MKLRITIPPLTRVLLAALLFISITSQILRLQVDRFDRVSLVPQYSIFYPWTFLTATFAERNPLTLVIAVAVILYGGRYLERAWGSMEFGKFILIISVLSNVIAVIFYICFFTLDVTRVIRSSAALQASFLVAFKQLVPEHTVNLLSSHIRIRVKHFPFLYLLLQTLSGIFLRTRAAFTLAWVGFLTSWVYLRFIKRTADEFGGAATGNMRGDPSSLFAFACFFPNVAQPVVSQLTDRIFDFLVRFRLLKPFTSEEMSVGEEIANARTAGELPSLMNPTGASGGGGGGGGSGGRGGAAGSAGRHREEAERRRRLALEALDQRLAAASNRGKRPQAGNKVPAPAPPSQRSEDAGPGSGKTEDDAAPAATGEQEKDQI